MTIANSIILDIIVGKKVSNVKHYSCHKLHNYLEDFVNIAEYKVMRFTLPPIPAETIMCAKRTEHKVES